MVHHFKGKAMHPWSWMYFQRWARKWEDTFSPLCPPTYSMVHQTTGDGMDIITCSCYFLLATSGFLDECENSMPQNSPSFHPYTSKWNLTTFDFFSPRDLNIHAQIIGSGMIQDTGFSMDLSHLVLSPSRRLLYFVSIRTRSITLILQGWKSASAELEMTFFRPHSVGTNDH